MKLSEKLKADIKHLTTSSVGGKPKPAFILFFIKKAVRIVVIYRVLNHFYLNRNKVALLLLSPLKLYFRLMTSRYCTDISYKTKIGPGFKLNHSYGIIVNIRSTIGENVYLGHNVTVGSNSPSKFPKIGNNVTIFPGSIIIGDVTIGDNVTIGAGSLVVKDVPANTVVGGHPSKILRTLSNIDI
ncbi:serine acetyltransferase [Mucilaginibacter celer]|uniref:Serine acetyltransferase n=1 Tax=Mucilaginibacter celer TaxID=2305508 RepID=A0A494VNW2_9SPHI|nr:serine acetyltransferase [Mucilaginibacter celer]AYL97117.1 serine acetyltransferase [Mucilaginibacter celer]